MMTCSPKEVYRRFGGTKCLHRRDQKHAKQRKEQEASSKVAADELIKMWK
jgi:hypothetical protein